MARYICKQIMDAIEADPAADWGAVTAGLYGIRGVGHDRFGDQIISDGAMLLLLSRPCVRLWLRDAVPDILSIGTALSVMPGDRVVLVRRLYDAGLSATPILAIMQDAGYYEEWQVLCALTEIRGAGEAIVAGRDCGLSPAEVTSALRDLDWGGGRGWDQSPRVAAEITAWMRHYADIVPGPSFWGMPCFAWRAAA